MVRLFPSRITRILKLNQFGLLAETVHKVKNGELHIFTSLMLEIPTLRRVR
jgi:hypothetical protein